MTDTNNNGRPGNNRLPELEIPNIHRLSGAYRTMMAWKDMLYLTYAAARYEMDMEVKKRKMGEYFDTLDTYYASREEYQKVGGRLEGLAEIDWSGPVREAG